MNKEMTFEVHFDRREHGRAELVEGAAAEFKPVPTSPARIARLVALAHHIDGLVRAGTVRDYAQVAELAGITRARVSQIVALLNLAPDLQERLLGMTRPEKGRERVGEREMRPICLEPVWERQREMFKRVLECRNEKPTMAVPS